MKAIIFDFDDTLEDWTGSRPGTIEQIKNKVHIELSIDPDLFVKIYKNCEKHYILNTDIKRKYDRFLWFSDAFKELDIKVTKKYVDELVDFYWRESTKRVKLFAGVKPLLRQLKKRYKLGILSNSDGNRSIKIARIKELGVYEYFDKIVTGDSTGYHKPDKRAFLDICKKLKVKPEDCVMVGDHPQHDLVSAKRLGMTAVFVKQGVCAKKEKDFKAHYAIDHISQLKGVLNQIEKAS